VGMWKDRRGDVFTFSMASLGGTRGGARGLQIAENDAEPVVSSANRISSSRLIRPLACRMATFRTRRLATLSLAASARDCSS
jgi:hypothetical protein